MADADREEKLRLAREKLKKFQKQQHDSQKTPTPEPRPSPQHAIKEVPHQVQSSQNQEDNPQHELPSLNQQQQQVEEHTIQQEVLARDLNNYFASSASDPFSSPSGDSALVSSTADHIMPAADHIPPIANHILPNGDHHHDEPLQNLCDAIGSVLQQSAVASESLPTAESDAAQTLELERRNRELADQLQQHVEGIKQWETYCQNMSAQLTSLQEALEQERENKSADAQNDRALRRELDKHKDSIELLVAEKVEAEVKLGRMEHYLQEKEAEVCALRAKPRAVEADESVKQEVKDRNREIVLLKRDMVAKNELLAEKSSELDELRTKLVNADRRIADLADRLSEAEGRLEMSEIHLAQMKKVNGEDDEDGIRQGSEIDGLRAQVSTYVQRESELTAYIQQARLDRQNIIDQYTAYGQQLATELEAKVTENAALADREAGLVKHIGQLETQLQKLIQGKEEAAAAVIKNEDGAKKVDSARVDQLETTLHEMVKEKEGIQAKMREMEHELETSRDAMAARDRTIGDLETEAEMLRSMSAVNVSHDSLMAACESDKVAASRATKQNVQLKEQLAELQNAVIELNNGKAELLLELDSMKSRLSSASESESTLKLEHSALQAAVKERDRQVATLRDQVKYYVAFAENSVRPDEAFDKVNAELQEAKDEVRFLNSANAELRGQIEVLSAQTRENTGTPSGTPNRDDGETPSSRLSSEAASGAVSGTSSMASSATATPVHHVTVAEEEDKQRRRSLTPVTASDVRPALSRTVPLLTPDVAAIKLEGRFKQAMDRIAELAAEKERLEHVNVQLQVETEAVGDFITIYQYQRKQLRLRMDEKERQLAVVAEEREDLRTKLADLQRLVDQLVGGRRSSHDGQENGQREGVGAPNGPPALSNGVPESPSSPSAFPSSPADPKALAADEIRRLITEIGASQMVSGTGVHAFQPYFWEHSLAPLKNV